MWAISTLQEFAIVATCIKLKAVRGMEIRLDVTYIIIYNHNGVSNIHKLT